MRRERERESSRRHTNWKEKFSSHFGKVDGEVSSEIVSRSEFREVVVETPTGSDRKRTALTDTSTESFTEPLDFLL
jgi:hypothetical protein